jgi:CheY-like chemotaxis protein
MSKAPKIMIVDDDQDFIDATSMILKSANYDVVSVSSPKKVKEVLEKEKPDLILLDIMMDSLFDGFSLCNAIKGSEEFKEFSRIPIIFISAVKELTGSRFNINEQEEGFKGPDAYLDKPVNPSELIQKIEELLTRK